MVKVAAILVIVVSFGRCLCVLRIFLTQKLFYVKEVMQIAASKDAI